MGPVSCLGGYTSILIHFMSLKYRKNTYPMNIAVLACQQELNTEKTEYNMYISMATVKQGLSII